MRRYKPLIGVFLILLAIAGILFWELMGRDAVVMETILVAGEQIEKGVMIEEEMVKGMSVVRESKVAGAYSADQIGQVIGRPAARRILPNEQFGEQMFYTGSQVPYGMSVFRIKPEWIDSRSSSLRKGDVIAIYGAVGEPEFGRYQVAYVKDHHDQEVESMDLIINGKDSILDRTSGTSQVSHVEIIASLEDYHLISSYAKDLEEGSLLLVQITEETGG